MQCQECEIDFKENHGKCPICGAVIAPERFEDRYVKWLPLLKTYNSGDIGLIKSLLDSEGINYYVKGENFSLIYPLVEPSIVMIQDDQLEEAKNILSILDLTFLGVSNGPHGHRDHN